MHFFTPSTSWASVQMIIMGVAGGMLNLSYNNYVLQKRTIINSANSEFIEIERKHMGEFHHKEMGVFLSNKEEFNGNKRFAAYEETGSYLDTSEYTPAESYALQIEYDSTASQYPNRIRTPS